MKPLFWKSDKKNIWMAHLPFGSFFLIIRISACQFKVRESGRGSCWYCDSLKEAKNTANIAFWGEMKKFV